jgi:parallel beta-helix repeat protein
MRRLLLIAGLVAASGSGAAANDLCGSTLTADLRLDHDLVCTGDGLVVGADGIRVDLNGHTVAGSGGGAGIIVVGRSDVTIANGVIRNFQTAVRLNAATGIVIRHTELVQNGDGIDVQAGGVGNTVKENTFRNHTVRAIMLRGGTSDNDVKNNTFVANRIGILVNGATDTELKDNLVSESSLTGIRFNNAATGNSVKDNILTSNLAGIEFLVTPPAGSSVGNEFKGNTLTGNGCGLLGLTAGNTFKDNTFEANVANTCP